MTKRTVTVQDACADPAASIGHAERGEPTVITRDGEPVAAVVPIADFEALEEAADVLDMEAVLAGVDPTTTVAELLTDVLTERPDEKR
ncbi:type II toxin-antitoxin system Phd/YefM family antitoxin [Streptomyces sp. NBC_01218]|uniref:type II toxin-antitoxin system Phd/YefM family antitoxin n=1 Tax=unclassified Streptomyces TaxID=2593676 RepID=UPI0023B8E1B3|nr:MULTISPECIES: type II toxin-antitoxin system Phd/YefM family antitoxin [unclassified Streptomyces]WEH40137.1 type II toxin-antitoxin system Phd/YefM family antitoxin [Streptomyces sp. AM 2-1-1]WSQ51830.1 type II toxin-antitoxin system Phd/YefM family antitoxin [Streptomyces sp. NBC_01218]